MRFYLRYLLVCSVLAGLLLAVGAALSRSRIERAFRDIETRHAQDAVLRARDAIREELDRMASACQDWGDWDDLYRYCAGANPDFPNANIMPRTHEVLRLNYILILDRQLTTLSESARALPTLQAVPNPSAFKIRFLEEGYFDRVMSGKRLTGFMNLGQTVLAFAAAPVRRSDGNGTPGGVIVFGCFIRETIASHLRERLGDGVDVLSFKDQRWYSAQEMPVNLDSRDVVPTTSLDGQSISASLLFGDISGIPAFVLVCRQPRDILYAGQTLWSQIGLLWAICLGVGLVGLAPLGMYLITGWLRRTLQVLRAAAAGEISLRLPQAAHGPGAELARDINNLLTRLEGEYAAAQLLRRQFDTVFRASSDGVLHCDLNARTITDCNRSLEELLGLTRAQILQQPFERLLPEDSRYLYMLDHLARQTEFRGELELRTASGECRPVEIRTMLFADAGRPMLQACLRDLSAVRQAQAREEQVRADLADAERKRSDFLTTLSHEMRTPLSAVIGFSDLAAEARSAAETQGWLKNIRRESVHLLDLVSNLLDHAGIEAGRLALHPEAADLRAFLRGLATTTQALLYNKKSVRFFLNIADNVGRCYCFDVLRLRQILLNLLGNAVKFTARGSVTLRVEAEARDEADQLTFSVIDTGIGIPEDAQPHIFESFVQAGKNIAREYGGTGLGAAIARKLALLMGGELTFHSTPGKGSEFTLSVPLPRQADCPVDLPADLSATASAALATATAEPALASSAQEPANANATNEPAANVSDTTVVLRRRTEPADILLVEDYALNRQVASAFVRHSGHNLFISFNGQDAVDKCRTRAFELILMDVQLPILDGLEATRQIRAQGLNRNTPVVGITACAEPAAIDACRRAGMNEVLAKPFTKDAFCELLSRTIGVLESPAQASEASEQLPRDYIVRHFFFGKLDLAQKALDIFLKDAQPLLAAIAAGIEEGDANAVQLSAHQIKSGAGYLGLSALQDICQSIAEQARTGLTDGLDVLLKDATVEYQRIRTQRAGPSAT